MNERFSASTTGELLDIVNEYGEPTGEVRSKKAIHEQGLPHRDVHVWLTNGHDLLQQRRNLDKSIMPGEWDISVGGHVGAGESYLEAAVRETSEELGLELPAHRFHNIGMVATKLLFPGWKQPHNIVGDNFVIVEPGLQLSDLRLQQEEVMNARWYPIDRLGADLQNPITAELHAKQPMNLYRLGIGGLRRVIAEHLS